MITSSDWLREVKGRRDLDGLAPGGLVIADDGVTADLPAGLALTFPLRRMLAADAAALGAAAVLAARTGVLEREALLAAVDSLGGKDAGALRATVETAWSLGAPTSPGSSGADRACPAT